MNLITQTHFEKKFTTVATLKMAVSVGLAIEEKIERRFKGFYSGTDYTYKTIDGQIIYSCSNMAGFGLNTWDAVELSNGIYRVDGVTEKLNEYVNVLNYELFHLSAELAESDPNSNDAVLLRGQICTIESKLKRLLS